MKPSVLYPLRPCFFLVTFFLSLAHPQDSWAQNSNVPPNYFRAVGYVIGQIRTVKWMEELCSERFPDTKAKNVAAYEKWSVRYAAFINEMEGQFGVIERHWQKTVPNNKDASASVRKLSDALNTHKQALRTQNSLRGEDTYRWMCEVYPDRVATLTNDLETALADRVAIIRRGPN
ncbi:MAG TPA: hypothetical protein VGD52_05090 [Pseudoduganella sp.]